MTPPTTPRPRHRRLTLGLLATALTGALALGIDGALVSPATAAPAPRATVSLSGWNLTLPVDSSGCQCGDAAQLSPRRSTRRG